MKRQTKKRYGSHVTTHAVEILFLDCHRYLFNKTRATISKWPHLETRQSRASTCCSKDNVRIQYVAMFIAYRNLEILFLLKIIASWQFHVPHHKAHIPTWLWGLSCLLTPMCQFPKIERGGQLNTIYTIRHKRQAKGPGKNKCCIYSPWSQ
jgi:hypothetical protein